METCRGASVPLHVSELLERWALKYTSSGEAPAWHKVLASLRMDDKIHISEHAPTRVSIHLLGTPRAGDPATQLLWNVNGFSSRWRSSQVVLEKDMASVVAGNASQTKKKRQLKRKIAKADFKTMVVTSGSPDFLTIVESKLSLAKMMALPGFISWCEHMGYHHIALSWSTNESKGGAGYAGIMTLSKVRPISTTFDFEGVPTEEARCVTHEFESFIHVSVYSPCLAPNKGTKTPTHWTSQLLSRVDHTLSALGGNTLDRVDIHWAPCDVKVTRTLSRANPDDAG